MNYFRKKEEMPEIDPSKYDKGPQSEQEEIINKELGEESGEYPSSYEFEQEQKRKSGEHYRKLTGEENVSNEESYGEFISNDAEVNANDKEHFLKEKGLSIEDLDKEDYEELLSIKDKESLVGFGDRIGLQKDFTEFEKSPFWKTLKLLEKLPYQEQMEAKKEIAKIRKDNSIEEGDWDKLSGREKYLHNRKKNEEINNVKLKYLDVKQGLRIDPGKEEPDKYESKLDKKFEEEDKKAEDITKKTRSKFRLPWFKWKKMSKSDKEWHKDFINKEVDKAVIGGIFRTDAPEKKKDKSKEGLKAQIEKIKSEVYDKNSMSREKWEKMTEEEHAKYKEKVVEEVKKRIKEYENKEVA